MSANVQSCWKCKVQPERIFTHQPDYWPSAFHVRRNQLVKRGTCASVRAKLESRAKCYYIFWVMHLLLGLNGYFTGHHFIKYVLGFSIGEKEQQSKTSSRGQNVQVDPGSRAVVFCLDKTYFSTVGNLSKTSSWVGPLVKGHLGNSLPMLRHQFLNACEHLPYVMKSRPIEINIYMYKFGL